MKIVFIKRSENFFVISLCPMEEYERILMLEIKEKNKDGDIVLYQGYDEDIVSKLVFLKFPENVLHFIGSREEDKNKINLLMEILRNSKKITLLKKKKSVQLCVYL